MNNEMIINRLYEVLFNTSPIPEELNDKNKLEEFKSYVNSQLSTSIHTRRQLILAPGQVADRIYFVGEGLVRGYTLDEAIREEDTIYLWTELTLVTEITSFFYRKPADLYIEVMPGSTLLSISYQQLTEIFRLFPFSTAFINCITLQYAVYHAKRSSDYKHLSAWQRYVNVWKACPDIEQRVSKEILASFLGMTRQSLSRLIKKNGHP